MFIVIELQKNGDQIANIVTTYDNINAADNKYYTIMAAAAISNVETHAVSMLTDEGYCLKYGFYEHNTEENNE